MVHEHIHKLRKHKNALYVIVVILLIVQIMSFISLSSKVTKLESDFSIALETAKLNLSKSFASSLELYDEQNQQNFNELAQALAKQEATQSSALQEIKMLKSSSGDFSGIVEDAVKSVVTIATDKSAGSGFIISSDGYVVTNWHVLQGARRLGIQTYDKQIHGAQIIGYDDRKDIALLKMEGSFDALEFGDSDSLQVGRKVIAIGNPLGLSFTVTEGIVSALNREGPNGETDYIQTDVSLNPGNSGGPLIDLTGKVIGVNNFKVGDAESLGFALESNIANSVVNELIAKAQEAP